MDEMTAFDRQIAGEVLFAAGPSEPVDDLAIFEAVTAAHQSPGWGSTMSSALKFIAAGVIVALFGGFLLAGILTTPQDGEVLPAAVTESPSPTTTTEELLSGMITEEVEPGVYRVINDGVRDLSLEALWGWWIDIVAGLDGSTWIVTDHDLFRLGDEQTHAWLEEMRDLDSLAPLGVDREGKAWLGGSVDGGSWRGLFALDGETWTAYAPPDIPAGVALSQVELGPDGAPWVALDCCDSGLAGSPSDVALPILARLADGAWETAHTKVPDRGSLHVGADGPFGFIDEVFSRYDGTGWQPQEMPYEGTDSFSDLDQLAGPENTLWLGLWGECPADQEDACGETDSPRYGLARYDGSGWKEWLSGTFPERDGENLLSALFLRTVGADGSLWGSIEWGGNGASWPGSSGDAAGCDGVVQFDGVEVIRHLRGLCVGPMEVTPDGAVWLLASETPSDSADVYVITPEAVAAKEAEATKASSAEVASEMEEASTTASDLLSGTVTEEVEPGVLRVLNDGVRDISFPLGGGWGLYSGFVMDITPDGSVWLSSPLGEQGLFRFGEEPVFEDVNAWPPYREVAPDGSLWSIGCDPDNHCGILSFDGEGWTVWEEAMTGSPHALAVGPDGTVWTMGEDRNKHCPGVEGGDCPGAVLERREDDGSFTTIEDWSDVYDGDANLRQLAVSPDGDVWLVGTPGSAPRGAELLLRFDGEGWEAIPGPEEWNPGERSWYRYLDFGPTGALWVRANRTGGIARFDDPGWTTFTEADGVEPWGEPWGETNWPAIDLFNVAADGSLWLLGGSGGLDDVACNGVAHYHGSTWTSYLTESCVHDFAIAPDGNLWLGASDYNTGSVGLYVIIPEAVAGTEK